jgi:hypothetical protein
VVILAQLADHGGGLVDGSGDEVGIVAVRRVPVASIEYSDGLIANCGERLEEADKSVLVVDLRRKLAVRIPISSWVFGGPWWRADLQFWPGRHDERL